MAISNRFILLPHLWKAPVLDFLCPALLRGSASTRDLKTRNRTGPGRRVNCLHTESIPVAAPPQIPLLRLPQSCPGCGAYTQATSPDAPGFYNVGRKTVKTYLSQSRPHIRLDQDLDESAIIQQVLQNAEESLKAQLGFSDEVENRFHQATPKDAFTSERHQIPLPICDRCHRLLHHNSYEPATHMTLQSVHNIIAESPHKYNHIYHVLDAADFPLSLIPSLQRSLSLSPLRSRNRRASKEHYFRGRKAEISFIITRSDLLAPTKDQVDGLMPYLISVLRDAIGGSAEHVRLGNVRCVSAKRGWWTKTVKEDIWTRGGGGWMVGKANVGKSNLLETIFPKGHTDIAPPQPQPLQTQETTMADSLDDHQSPDSQVERDTISDLASEEEKELPFITDSLLPPAPTEQRYPTLPIVSALPGTTAAPIRNIFGNGRGELIDLPGLNRGDLHSFVEPQHRMDLIMNERIKAEQLSIKPGQSLLLGGLVMITPLQPDVTFLAYSFVPLPTHITSTDKAKAMMDQQSFPDKSSFARPGIAHRLLSAGTFPLKWDVTKDRAGPLTRKSAVGLSTRALSFSVLSADILVEGCGWIEIVAQVRKRYLEDKEQSVGSFDTTPYPLVEVISPDGRHIGLRKPMGAWLLGRKRITAKPGSRPRPGMRGMKKHFKKEARAADMGAGP